MPNHLPTLIVTPHGECRRGESSSFCQVGKSELRKREAVKTGRLESFGPRVAAGWKAIRLGKDVKARLGMGGIAHLFREGEGRRVHERRSGGTARALH